MHPDTHPTPDLLEMLASGLAVPDEVSQHSSRCPQCAARVAELRSNNEFLADLQVAIRPGAARGEDAPPSVPGYRLLEPISAGGQGVVYRAVQELTGRVVAVKMLTGGWFATDRARKRFEREIDIIAGLNHPNIATIYNAVQLRTGVHAFAMEYIEGEPLDRWQPLKNEAAPSPGEASTPPKAAPQGPTRLLGAPDDSAGPGTAPATREPGAPAGPVRARRRQSGPPSLAEIRAKLTVFAKVCDAVHHAHQRGVIHRDIKPSNILTTAAGEPKVLDFGIALIAADAADTSDRITQSGAFTGTIEFASPEQAEGDIGGLDFRTDVYSLGVILYSMLTGRLPYRMEGLTLDKLNAIRQASPRPPVQVNPLVRGDLQTIILKALEKDRTRRYQTAQELRRDILHYLADEPIEARRDSVLYVLGKKARKHRARIAGIGLVAVLALGAAGVQINSHLALERERSITAQKLAREESNKVAAIDSAVAILRELAGAGTELDLARVGDAARAATRSVAAAGRTSTPATRAEMCLRLADALIAQNMGAYARFPLDVGRSIARADPASAAMLPEFDSRAAAIAAANPLVSPQADDAAEMLSRGESAIAAGDAATAADSARRAEAAWLAAPGDHACDIGAARELLSRALLRTKRISDALDAAERAQQSAQGCARDALALRVAATACEAALASGDAGRAWEFLSPGLERASALSTPFAGAMAALGRAPVQAMSSDPTLREPVAAVLSGACGVLRAAASGDERGTVNSLISAAARLSRFQMHGPVSQMLPSLLEFAQARGDKDLEVDLRWSLGRARVAAARDAISRGAATDVRDLRRSALELLLEAKSLKPESLTQTFSKGQAYDDNQSHAFHLMLACDATGDRSLAADVVGEEISASPRPDFSLRSRYAVRLALAGRLEECRAQLEQLDILVSSAGDRPDSRLMRARAANARVLYLALAGKPGEAVQLSDELAGLPAEVLPPDQAAVLKPIFLAHRAFALSAAGRWEDAAAAFEASLDALIVRPDRDCFRYVVEGAIKAHESRNDKARASFWRSWIGEGGSV